MSNYNFLERIKPQGYQDKLDDSLLDFYCLTRGSQNVLINDEHKIVKRKGYTLFGQKSVSGKPIKSSYTWECSSNKEILLRSFYDALQVYYNGEYRTIYTGFKYLSKFRYDKWWNRAEGKDKLLMVNGASTVKSWTGGMTEIASWTATSITKKYAKQSSATNNFVFNATIKTLTQTDADFITLGFKVGDYVSIKGSVNNNDIFRIKTLTASVMTFRDQDNVINETISNTDGIVGVVGKETWRAERFLNTSGNINIGGTVFAYTAGADTPTLTLATDPSSVAVAGAFVFQPVEVETISGTDFPANFPVDIIAVNINQAYYASTLFRNVYISKQSDYKDVNYSATLRKAGEGATITLDSNVVGIATSKEETYITAGISDAYKVYFDPFSDGTTAGEIVRVKHLATAYGQGAVSHEAFVKIKNGILYLSNEPTIDFIGNLEQIAGQSSKPLSDAIKRLLNRIDRTDAVGVYVKNYVLFLFPNASTLIMYDLERGFWQPPQIISASCMNVANGEVIIHSDFKDESYTLFKTLNDDEKPIIAKAFTNIETSGGRSKRIVYDECMVEAVVNNFTNSVKTEVLSGYKGAINKQTFEFGFDENDNYVEKPESAAGIGTTPFGYSPFGGLLTEIDEDVEVGNLRLVRKISSTSILETFTKQVSFENDEINSYFEIIMWGTNDRVSTTTNLDLKE